MRIVCLSDTHGQHRQLVGPFAVPDGDVLVHAGDFTARDGFSEHVRFLDWLASLPHPVKVIVAGNHDGQWAHSGLAMRQAAEERGTVYLEHEAATVGPAGPEDGDVAVFGSPWTPAFMDWHFMYPRAGDRAERLWSQIPDGLDLLVSHGPPHGVRDKTTDGTFAGCELLWRRLTTPASTGGLGRPPRLHVFGHIHEAAGVTRLGDPERGTLCVNASVVDERYRVCRPPVVVDVTASGAVHRSRPLGNRDRE